MPWFNKKDPSRRTARGNRKRSLRPEALQRRELMAADFIGFEVDVQSGVMHIEGTDQADSVEVFIDDRGNDDPVDDLVQVKMTEANGDQRTGGSPRYWQNGTPRITSLKFEGFDGNDTFNVNFVIQYRINNHAQIPFCVHKPHFRFVIAPAVL